MHIKDALKLHIVVIKKEYDLHSIAKLNNIKLKFFLKEFILDLLDFHRDLTHLRYTFILWSCHNYTKFYRY